MANSKKQLLIDLLNSDHPTTHGDHVVEGKHVTEQAENRFRVETTRAATDANKAKHGDDLPDDLIAAEYLVLTDKEAAGDNAFDGEVFKGGVPTADKKFKAYRIA